MSTANKIQNILANSIQALRDCEEDLNDEVEIYVEEEWNRHFLKAFPDHNRDDVCPMDLSTGVATLRGYIEALKRLKSYIPNSEGKVFIVKLTEREKEELEESDRLIKSTDKNIQDLSISSDAFDRQLLSSLVSLKYVQEYKRTTLLNELFSRGSFYDETD